tara:strand:+ start:418 stop:1071 length:654 start_codon:yes stop_codon:yes gene_type:complete
MRPVESDDEVILGSPAAVGSVVWLHGLGADGWDFVPIVPELERDDLNFIFPHAKVRPVTLNFGLPMRAWYDITDLGRLEREAGELDGLLDSVERIEARLIELCNEDIPVVLVGFSQGGAVASVIAQRGLVDVRAVAMLSSYAPKVSAPSQRSGLPMLHMHGSSDPTVPMQAGQLGHEHHVNLGAESEWFTYPMGHNVCPEQVGDLRSWLSRHLPASQ